MAVANLDDPAELAHMIAGALRIKTEEKQALLEERDVAQAAAAGSPSCSPASWSWSRSAREIQSQVQSEIDKGQREYFLRQQLKAIQEELGEGDETQAEADRAARADRAGAACPSDARKQAERELQRFERLPPQAAEHGVIRTYLEWLADAALVEVDRGQPRPRARAQGARPRPLRHREGQGPHPRVPRRAQAQARRALVDPLLRRAARRRQDLARPLDRRGDGPRTSSASRSAACATSRRSAATAAPTSARCRARSSGPLRDAGANNPVLMIDEIDKMGADFRGDPASAMLEVLDPEQNSTLPRPLPRPAVRPLARRSSSARRTSSTRSRRPLRDRMEVIELSGYTQEEKLEIAKRYLVPRQIERNGLGRSKIEFTDEALDEIIDGYTREAGVRELEREIGVDLPQGRARVRRGHAQVEARRSAPRQVRELLGKRALPAETSSAARTSPGSPPASPGRRSAATCCSSRRRPSRATAGSRSPASSAT